MRFDHWLDHIRRQLKPGCVKHNRRRDARNKNAAHSATAELESLEPRLLLSVTNPLKLATLDRTNGFRIEGLAERDRLGNSVANAGDVNGDGYDDLIIGASDADPREVSGAGSAYVIFGQPGGFSSSLDLNSLDGTNGFTFNGIEIGDEIGTSVAGAGDNNGDGFDDVIIGTDINYGGPTALNGELHIVLGRPGTFDEELNAANLDGSNGFTIQTTQRSVNIVANAGDINGDGIHDVAFQSTNEGFVVFGTEDNFPAIFDASVLDGVDGFRIRGDEVQSIAGAGDINGDGFDDLLVESTEYVRYSSSTGPIYDSRAAVILAEVPARLL